MREPLTDEQIQTALRGLPGWSHENDRLQKSFELADFQAAIAFIVHLAFSADKLDHHPELANVYNRVTISLSTHDAGNRVTEMDVKLARAIEEAARAHTASA
ncbi:MAG TPA: 4a-hydroxytetrahydrobiopterin dehydratase [Rhodothermales bacterium]|nr:4a-hydroxytetrahydrobiopterin dehydratase [Rhodothermales bacterium]